MWHNIEIPASQADKTRSQMSWIRWLVDILYPGRSYWYDARIDQGESKSSPLLFPESHVTALTLLN